MAARVAITISSLTPDTLVDALMVLCYADCLYLRRQPQTPALYSVRGLRFLPERQAGSGVELYQTIPEVIAQGWGDCDDLAGWRAAELICSGEPGARPDLIRVAGPSSAPYWHAVVRRASGAIEDPAAIVRAREGR